MDFSSPKDTHKIGWKLCYAVSKFTETYSFGNPSKIKFVGLPSDVEFAKWLNEAFVMFIRTQLKDYIWKNNYTSLPAANKRIVINGFVYGCSARINTRLMAMVANRHNTTNSTALVIAKQSLIDDLIKDFKISTGDNRGRKPTLHDASYEAGKAAGDRATFGRPVNGQGSVKLIGN